MVAHPLTKHELGEIGEAVIDEGIARLNRIGKWELRIICIYKDNRQHSHPDRVFFVHYKHRFYVLAIEAHNHHQHYVSPTSWVQRNDINKFRGVMAHKKVSFGSYRYSKRGRASLRKRVIDDWRIPNAIETREAFWEAVGAFLIYMAFWLRSLDSSIKALSLSSLKVLLSPKVNNRSVNSGNIRGIISPAKWWQEASDG